MSLFHRQTVLRVTARLRQGELLASVLNHALSFVLCRLVQTALVSLFSLLLKGVATDEKLGTNRRRHIIRSQERAFLRSCCRIFQVAYSMNCRRSNA